MSDLLDREEFYDDDDSLPILRNDEPTLKERMTENAYESILPARYLSEGETQEDLFERVGQNVAVAEAVHTDEIVTITSSEIKPDHPSRDELITEVFGEGDEQSFAVELTEENAKHVAYDPLIDRLAEIDCEQTLEEMKMFAEKYVNLMERLQFMPNSPTLMNAGDELQQLSACIAGHVPVYTRKGLKQMEDIQVGNEVLTHESRFKPVTAHWSNGSQETVEIADSTANRKRYDMQLTPDYEVLNESGKFVEASELEQPAKPQLPTEADCDAPETIRLIEYMSAFSQKKKKKTPVVDGGKLKLKNTDDPRTAEYDQQLRQPNAKVVNDSDFAWIAGLYLADGDITTTDLRFTLNKDDEELLNKLDRLVSQVFDVPVTITESNAGNWIVARVSSPWIVSLFETMFGTGAHEKKLPDWIGNTSNQYRQSLLDALLAADACDTGPSHKLTMANPTLVYEATLLARSVGCDATFHLEGENELSVHDTSRARISKPQAQPRTNLQRRQGGTVEVYDMEVAVDHSFVAGDFVVYNLTEPDTHWI